MLLDAEFRSLSQGALSIDEYCRKMKGIADSLADLGEPVSDRTFVLNLLSGLNEQYKFMAQLVTRQHPFPTFADVRADLRLAELNMTTPSSPASALVTTAPSRPPAPSPAAGSSTPHPPPAAGGTSSNNTRGRRRRGGRGQGSPSGSTAGSSMWPFVLNPWTGSIHMWPGPSASGPRGPPPRPSPLPHQGVADRRPSSTLRRSSNTLRWLLPRTNTMGHSVPCCCFQHRQPQPTSKHQRVGS
jgi:hypothetical protein